MFQLNNFFDNKNMVCIDQQGCFRVLEHQRDLSVSPDGAETEYFAAQMNRWMPRLSVLFRLLPNGNLNHRQSSRGFPLSICLLWLFLR